MTNQAQPTSDDTTYIRISKRELLSYIQLQTQLNAVLKENEDLRNQLLSSSLVTPPLQPEVLATNPTSSAHQELRTDASVRQSTSSAGPVLPAPTNDTPAPSAVTITGDNTSFQIKSDEPLALVNSALAAFPPPPVTAEAYDENGRIILKEITSSSVNYAAIIETVIELLKLQDYNARLQRNPITDDPIPTLYLPYLMTPETTRIIMNAVELGVTRYRAAALAGISKHTYNDWKQKSSQQLEPYASFFALFELAEARTETALVHAWRTHARDSWQAVDGFLKKRFRNEWGEKSTVQLTRADVANLPTSSLEEALGPEAIAALNDDDSTIPSDDNDQQQYATDTIDYNIDDVPPTETNYYPTRDDL